MFLNILKFQVGNFFSLKVTVANLLYKYMFIYRFKYRFINSLLYISIGLLIYYIIIGLLIHYFILHSFYAHRESNKIHLMTHILDSKKQQKKDSLCC